MVLFYGLHLALPSALPWVDFPNSLDTLSTFAGQLQSVITAAVTHPFWAIGLIVLSIGLIQLVADIVKRMIKAALAFLLKLPLVLSQWIWKKATIKKTADSPEEPVAQAERLLTRLEALREEQDQLMAELKALLQAKPMPSAAIPSALKAPQASLEADSLPTDPTEP